MTERQNGSKNESHLPLCVPASPAGIQCGRRCVVDRDIVDCVMLISTHSMVGTNVCLGVRSKLSDRHFKSDLRLRKASAI